MGRKVTCQFCNTKDDKEKMIKFNNKNYHSNCLDLLYSRDKTIDLFYNYTKSQCMKKDIYNAFKVLKTNGLNEHDILYVMEYIIENKHKLNYPLGLRYYIDRALKDKKTKDKLRQQEEERINKLQSEIFDIKIPIKKNEKDELDVSDIFDI